MKTIAAAEFKAKCLALIDRVHDEGESITITKRGRTVARLVPAGDDERPWLRVGERCGGTTTRSPLRSTSATSMPSPMAVPLLDTHAWIWWIEGDRRLPRRVRDTLDRLPRDERPYLSAISLWEVAMLVERGRVDFSVSLSEWLDAAAHARSVRSGADLARDRGADDRAASRLSSGSRGPPHRRELSRARSPPAHA